MISRVGIPDHTGGRRVAGPESPPVGGSGCCATSAPSGLSQGGSGAWLIFTPFHCWPHQQWPSALMMQVPLPQQRGSSLIWYSRRSIHALLVLLIMPLMIRRLVGVTVESSGEDDCSHHMNAEFGGGEINAVRWCGISNISKQACRNGMPSAAAQAATAKKVGSCSPSPRLRPAGGRPVPASVILAGRPTAPKRPAHR